MPLKDVMVVILAMMDVVAKMRMINYNVGTSGLKAAMRVLRMSLSKMK